MSEIRVVISVIRVRVSFYQNYYTLFISKYKTQNTYTP
jgi:hypothetical protein